MIYQTYDLYSRGAEVLNSFYSFGHHVSSHPSNPWASTLTGKTLAAIYESAYRSTKRYHKLGFHYDSVEVNGKSVKVHEHIVADLPFCQLRHFAKEGTHNQPKLLIVSPLSGHHATLLKDTVKSMLADNDVYLTDWKDARDVPAADGQFGFDDYVHYLIDFMEVLGPGCHMLAVCQPTVQALIATGVMAERKHPCLPKTLTLMAGPIDTRINPSSVNDYATKNDLEFFRRNVIKTVPKGYPGAGRKVYPGFLQLSAFVSMNLGNHIRKHLDFFSNVILGNHDDAEAHREFYDEYLAVLDMSADFYLETLERVFIEHHLPTGQIRYQGKPVDFSAITDTALHTVEGARDDICSEGQTEAAQTICTALSDDKRRHKVYKKVGHYGIFSGSKFRRDIARDLSKFIAKHN
ncbi:MAG: polyhydroxyalkanoate depolymerase [Cellvibrionaceae bacterium]|nr:polyhydroxyalkanoate depolymerase [Cellvibrionaceae bacterium]MCV6624823.1 polyhydroxyalkanoate depolymerase [Cellvibrionaceae bacterium]